MTELTYFLKIDLSSPKALSDFALFIDQAMKAGYMPVAGPIFRIPPMKEKTERGEAIIQIIVRKTKGSLSRKLTQGKLVYVASPSGLANIKDQIIDYVEKKNNAWLHPFHSLPYEYFEGSIGREPTMDFCCKLIDICDELWVMGISDGTLTEINYFLSKKTISAARESLKIFVKQFNPDWKKTLKKTG